MKIVVCINHVPDTETKIKIAQDNVSIDKAGVNYMLSPYDEFAVEEALRLREKFKGEVTAVSVGSDAQAGADRDAAVARLHTTTSLEDLADCDLIIEAVVEDLAAKNEMFAALDGLCPPETIFASNTSSLPIAAMAASTPWSNASHRARPIHIPQSRRF